MYYVRTKKEFPFGTGPAMDVVLPSMTDAPDTVETESNMKTSETPTPLNVTTFTPDGMPNNDILKACIAKLY